MKTDRKKLSTRQRLLDAAVGTLRTSGAAAVTTQRLADEVGIVQSGVYRHFRGGEECLVAAAKEGIERIRIFVDEDRLLRGLAHDSDLSSVSSHLDFVLQEAQNNWPTFDLMRRFRQEDSKLGQTLTDGYELLVKDVVDHFRALETENDLNPPGERSRERLARVVIDMILSVAEEVKDAKSVAARKRAARELALMIQGGAARFYEAIPR